MWLEVADLPISAPLRDEFGAVQAARLALGAGDDYELCVVVEPDRFDAAEQAVAATGLSLTRIGQFTEEPGVVLSEPELTVDNAGYQHEFGDRLP